jgi:alpha-mannosidase
MKPQLSWILRVALILAGGTLLPTSSYTRQSPPAGNGANRLFRVGIFDGSSAEFAQGQPDGEVRFAVGRSDPSKSWYAFQPALLSSRLPASAQGVSAPRSIDFQIRDGLAIAYQLRVALLFELPNIPSLRVIINGKSGVFYPAPQLDDRIGDPSGAHDPVYSSGDIAFVFPGSFLHSGMNTISLQAVEEADEAVPGAGFAYDAVELDRMEAGAVDHSSSSRIEPTIFYRERSGGLTEIVNVTIRSTQGLRSDDSIALSLDGKKYEKQIGVSRDFGEARLFFEVNEFPAESAAKADWRVGEQILHAEQVIAPQKKWTLFVVPHIHLDVGFTDFQSKVSVVQARAIDEAMDLVAAHPDFRFSIDGEWPLEQFLRTRTAEEQKRVIAALQNQQIYLPAQYANLLTGFPTAETLIRSLYPSANFSREHNTPFNYANITDVPSYSWSYASILASAGITDFAAAANNHRAPVLRQGHLNHHSPFWWIAPDGQKILLWYSMSYLQMSYLFGMPPILEAGEETLPLFLQQYEEPGYRASAAIIFGTQIENHDLFPEQATFADKWNAKWAYPRLKYSGFYNALETIRQQFGDNIPTYRGDGGPYWELGIGSDAYYVAMERQNESRGPSAEKLCTLASLIDPRTAVNKAALDEMWTSMILMDEHTWGSWNSVSDPASDEATEQLAIKDSYSIRARASVDALLKNGMATLANSISAGPNSLIVFNALNWPRSGLIDFDLNKGQELFDPSTSSVVPIQIVRAENELNRVRFVAQDVPALGYKVYRFRATSTPGASPVPVRSAVLESPYYRVELDAATGAVRSIYDKELRRELVDQESNYRLGQYLYVTDANPANNQHMTWYRGKLDLQIHPSHEGRILSVTRTPYGSEAQMESIATNTPRIATTVRLFDHERKIEFVEDVEKDKVPTKEAVYFAFPFAIRHPQFQYELQTTSMDPAKDMYPGAGHEWFSVQHWASVQADGVSASVLPLDAPLVTLGDIDRGQWLDTFGDRRATIFSFAMNNYWEDNYASSQGGKFQFRYIVTSAPSTNEGQLSRLGWEEVTPLEVDEITREDKAQSDLNLLDAEQAGFAKVDDPNLLLDTRKPAEDQSGTILRFLDLGGQTRIITVRLPAFRVTAAWQTDAVERNLNQLHVNDGHEFSFTMHSHEIVTVRIATDGTDFAAARIH